MKADPLVIERSLNEPSEKVWKAITDKKDMKQWYFDIAEFKPEVGFEFQFEGGKDDKRYLHICEITEVVVGKNSNIAGVTKGLKANPLLLLNYSPLGKRQ